MICRRRGSVAERSPMDENVIQLERKVQAPAPQQEPPSLESLMLLVEQMDRGMKLMIDVIAQYDYRLRALELAVRKLARKNVPAIVNQRGQPVRSN